MKNFAEWKKLNEVDAPVVPTTNPVVSSPASPQTAQPEKPKSPKLKIKPWKAGKEDIMSFWKGVQPSIPLNFKPIEYDHKGSTIQEDGIRITGSKEFITTVLSRLKDFISYENPETKLMVAYRQSPKSFVPGNRNSFIFYLQAKKRGKN